MEFCEKSATVQALLPRCHTRFAHGLTRSGGTRKREPVGRNGAGPSPGQPRLPRGSRRLRGCTAAVLQLRHDAALWARRQLGRRALSRGGTHRHSDWSPGVPKGGVRPGASWRVRSLCRYAPAGTLLQRSVPVLFGISAGTLLRLPLLPVQVLLHMWLW